MTDSLRLFIGMRLTPSRSLRRLIREVSYLGQAFKPVSPEQLHVTLKFLGEVELKRLPLLKQKLDLLRTQFSPQTLEVHGLGVFPKIERPMVLWCGIQPVNKDEPDKLTEMANWLSLELEELGFAPERRAFHSHVTLARIRRKPPAKFFELFKQSQDQDFGTTRQAEIELISSELNPTGAVYHTMHKIVLPD